MGRPEHLNCVNTAAGIRAINEAQRVYDADPSGWERREQEAIERRRMEEQHEYEHYKNCQRMIMLEQEEQEHYRAIQEEMMMSDEDAYNRWLELKEYEESGEYDKPNDLPF